MTVEQATEELSNLLGGFDMRTEELITDILERFYADAHEEGFDAGNVAGADLAAFDSEEGNDYGEEDQ